MVGLHHSTADESRQKSRHGGAKGALRLKTSYRVPCGQFSFIEDGLRLTGETPQIIAAKIAEYRKANRRTPGDPLREVIQKLCKEFPEIAEPEPLPDAPESAESDDSGLEAWQVRVKVFVASYANLAPRFCPPAETKMRKFACIGCPHNRAVTWEGAEKELLLTSRGGSMAAPDMKGCACWGHHNQLAVLLEAPTGKDPECQPPSNCWVSTLTDGEK